MEVRVRITDYSDFESDRCFNGGNYWFTTIYVPITYLLEMISGEVFHSTSADFEYCEFCGSFGDHSGVCTDPKVVKTEYVLSHINYVQNDDNYSIEFYPKEESSYWRQYVSGE
jgi:hypothetical protein